MSVDITTLVMPAYHKATNSLYAGALEIEDNRVALGLDNVYTIVVFDLVAMHWANKVFGWHGVDKRIHAAHRDADWVLRLGGDEYAVGVASHHDAVVMAERVCKAYVAQGLKARFAVVDLEGQDIRVALDRGLELIDLLKEAERPKGIKGILSRIIPAIRYIITGEIR